MSQASMVIDNGPGLSVRQAMNAAFAALASSNSGAVEPVEIRAGQLWLDLGIAGSPDGVLRIRNNANNAWIDIAAVAFNAGNASTSLAALGIPNHNLLTVNSAGSVVVTPTSGNDANLVLNKQSNNGRTNTIWGQTLGVPRWAVVLGNGVAEGANAGSDFSIYRYSDAGALLTTPISVARGTGQLSLNGLAIDTTGKATIPANLDIRPANASAVIQLNKQASGQLCSIQASTVNAMRWSLQLNSADLEQGNQSGADFVLSRYNDTGAFIDNNLRLQRSNGVAFFSSSMNCYSSMSIRATANQSMLLLKDAGEGNVGYLLATPSTGNVALGYGFGAGKTINFGASGDMVCPNQCWKPGGGPWADTSDARIKENVQDYTNGLASIIALRPITYNFKALTGRDASVIYHGLIAQEAELVMPEMVTQRDSVLGDIEYKDLRYMDTSALVFALVNSVKELNAKIATLEGRLPAAT